MQEHKYDDEQSENPDVTIYPHGIPKQGNDRWFTILFVIPFTLALGIICVIMIPGILEILSGLLISFGEWLHRMSAMINDWTTTKKVVWGSVALACGAWWLWARSHSSKH